MAEGLKRSAILLGFLGVVAALSVSSPAFLTPTNLLNIVRQSSIHGIMAVGMTLVILTSGIDLSVGSALALTGVLAASLEHRGWPVPLVVAAALLIGSLLGLANGLVITKGRVPPFVVTLGTMSIFRGAAHLFTGAQPISGFSPAFRSLGAGTVLRIPVPIILFVLSVVAAAALLRRTRWGRYLYAVGGNLQAARLSGIPVERCTTAAYVLCGLTAAAGAVVLTARLGAAESIAGTGYELDVIASVVIGGTSLAGGRGGVWGTLLGALLIGTINNGMNLLQIPAYFQLVVKGAIIIAAVLLDRLRIAADS
ncbi:MAG: ribose ABC transporter permease [Thermoguttaceae bacterium]|jgi:ribose/xylose/arabinose/galactoside ABC-type transport system permease subunit